MEFKMITFVFAACVLFFIANVSASNEITNLHSMCSPGILGELPNHIKEACNSLYQQNNNGIEGEKYEWGYPHHLEG